MKGRTFINFYGYASKFRILLVILCLIPALAQSNTNSEQNIIINKTNQEVPNSTKKSLSKITLAQVFNIELKNFLSQKTNYILLLLIIALCLTTSLAVKTFQSKKKLKKLVDIKTKELQKALDKAQQSNKLKSEFLAQMSHEIRTPIFVILGNIAILKGILEENSKSKNKELFDSIELASKRIIRTIELILNMSEMQIGTYKPTLKKIDLDKDVLSKLVDEHKQMAASKNLELIYNCMTENTIITGDEYSLTQIFANLIDNGIKYTKKGKVEISIKSNEQNEIIVEVSDTGIGMSKEFLSHLFEPFVQEERGYSRTYEGNGLGLALVKKYCELNNANIEVESEKGIGSTFRVILKNL
ncbi:sensor histidine kinase [Melioribacteraceae bacterium 4301-Me]|uniref:sensor histidine kinase n=1 Tax=Pyranulibacter aquaticus TaxID=3163344 RepID=UPI00359A83CF